MFIFLKAMNQRDKESKTGTIYVNEELQQLEDWQEFFYNRFFGARCGTSFITTCFFEIRKIFVIRDGMP